jgi:anti-anti-sigma factor
MEIIVNEIDGITLVSINGKLDSTTAPVAENEINSILEKQVKKMVVSLKDTAYVSSAGLRVFLATAKKMTAAGGAVKFCSPNDIVKEILDVSGFTSILDVKSTEEEALGSL